MSNRIDRPVFIVGMPRSGSTALFRVMAQLSGFATTTNITRKYPTNYPVLRLLNALYKKHEPGEAGRMWDKFVSHDHDVLRAEDVTEKARKYYTAAVSNVIRLYDQPRFLSKCPRLGLRIPFLVELFPDARFIHLIRDGRAVSNSIMERRKRRGNNAREWWDVKPEGWRAWQYTDPISEVAHQWNEVVMMTRTFGKSLPGRQYTEIRYEDFTREAFAEMLKIGSFCEMDWDEQSLRSAVKGIASRNDKWRQNLSDEDVAALERIMKPMMEMYGYL